MQTCTMKQCWHQLIIQYIIIKAIDNLPKNASIQKINQVLNRNQSETGGLAGILKIKINARVMFTVNIDLQDRLVNGQLETVMHIE